MENYKSNSIRSKEAAQNEAVERKKMEKVVSGNVKTKKQGEVKRFANSLISDDVVNVKSYILSDVLAPLIKDAITSAVKNTVDMIFYGSVRSDNSRRGGGMRPSYRDYYEREDTRSRRARANTYSFNDVEFDNIADAEQVLDEMLEACDRYGIVSVSDFYDLAGVPSDFTDCKYGWTDLRNARVERSHGMYIIRLPRALAL